MKSVVACAAVLALAGSARAAPVEAVAPGVVEFGDTFVYGVTGRAGDPRLDAPVAPFTRIGEPLVERRGNVVLVMQQLACLSEGCLGPGPTRRLRLGPRTIVVRGRVTPAEVAAGLSAYRRNTALAPHGDASGASRLLAAVAAVAALAALVAVFLALPRRRARVDALERAIRLLRESAARAAPDRRRAADLLARLVRGRADALEHDATTIAWSRRDPASSDTEELAARASQEVA